MMFISMDEERRTPRNGYKLDNTSFDDVQRILRTNVCLYLTSDKPIVFHSYYYNNVNLIQQNHNIYCWVDTQNL